MPLSNKQVAILMNTAPATYNDKVVRQFAVRTMLRGIVGMSVGALIGAQLF